MTAPIAPAKPRNSRENGSAWPYVLRFAVFASGQLALYYFPYDARGFAAACLRGYLRAYARLAGGVLSLLDPSVHVQGADIVGRYSLTFAMNCDAMDVYILFSSALLAFPASVRARFIGLAAGLAALVALNVLRIVSLYFVGVYAPGGFDFCHMDIWPLVIVVATCAGFLLWIRWSRALGGGGASAVAQA
jgi:exosortase/archaeosortase family protein